MVKELGIIMNILIYKWKVFNQADVKSAFEYFGHSVDMYEEKPLSSDSITGINEFPAMPLFY